MSLLLPAGARTARATTSRVTLDSLSSIRPRRRFFSHRAPLRTQQDDRTSSQIRSLMRATAQPVALVTTFLPPSSTHIHAATLSSFTSISLDPNLVCFSIKTPSKLADALAVHASSRREGGQEEVDFVVNMLSREQAGLAAAYAVPGTPPLAYPAEGKEGQEGQEGHPLAEAGLEEVGNVPVVKDSLGALACQVVESVDLDKFGKGEEAKSRLYIGRVVHVYSPEAGSKSEPLIYHRQKFVSATHNSLI